MVFLIAPILGIIALVCNYTLEFRANIKRIQNGQKPRNYHDLTNHEPPTNVINWPLGW